MYKNAVDYRGVKRHLYILCIMYKWKLIVKQSLSKKKKKKENVGIRVFSLYLGKFSEVQLLIVL